MARHGAILDNEMVGVCSTELAHVPASFWTQQRAARGESAGGGGFDDAEEYDNEEEEGAGDDSFVLRNSRRRKPAKSLVPRVKRSFCARVRNFFTLC